MGKDYTKCNDFLSVLPVPRICRNKIFPIKGVSGLHIKFIGTNEKCVLKSEVGLALKKKYTKLILQKTI